MVAKRSHLNLRISVLILAHIQSIKYLCCEHSKTQLKLVELRAVVLKLGVVSHPRDFCQHLKIFLVVTSGGGGDRYLVSRGQGYC